MASLIGVIGSAVGGGVLPAKTDAPTFGGGALLVLRFVALWVGLGGIDERLLERETDIDALECVDHSSSS
ncbi:hypothetical protein OB955_16875 [Halobacteria archaeon AArc-m2/3/4]|uniref:Uncharacterized protein n=1 Tax=Natronoglomus mannanivorans TaxID=2979990 RepID=A0AAP2Z3H0_9EURY|nr:hypothetical protein [Halobacteria archaeon AArc-xg1-1]MCU4974399.1 hypothetical protein [Halobacteria archaeon AArc-m2/3/4]